MGINLNAALAEPLALRGHFHVLDDVLGYGELLVRCSETAGHQVVYTDLYFEGVRYAELPAYLGDPVVRSGTAADVDHVAGQLRQPLDRRSQHVFVLESGPERYRILATGLAVSQHALLPVEPGLSRR